MISLTKVQAEGLSLAQFTAKNGELWCLVGGNGSGLAAFVDVLAGAVPFKAEQCQLPTHLGLLSFKQQQSIFEAELQKDDTDFINRLDPGTPARDFLTDIDRYRDQIELFNMAGLLDRGYRQLSSGQARKLCILQNITAGADFLVLENPYEGLDQASCRELDRVLSRLREQGLGIVVLVNNSTDIPTGTSHLGLFAQGQLTLRGPVAACKADILQTLAKQKPLFQVRVDDLQKARPQTDPGGNNLVTLNNGFARYGDVEVFNGLNLAINRGDHTLISGPNGCGKSTLLQIITGDHPLCYANDLTMFGRKRGTGETIWELKRYMGIVSADLHRNYRVAGSGLATVLSGLFDSIGLYDTPTKAQQQQGKHLMERLGLAAKMGRPFREFSYGEQRLLLLARALIKAPELLILDEPTQGLDEGNRKALLDFLEQIAAEDLATIVYVSHREDEYRPFFTQHIQFKSGTSQQASHT